MLGWWTMSGDWIKMRGDLYSDPEVVRAARLCKVDRDTIVGRLHRTWAWADKVTADGFVAGMNADDLNETLGIKGWAQALQAVGWLEVTESGLTFPRFDRHNGKSAKRRASDTDRKAEKRRNVSPEYPQSVRIESGQIADQRREEKRRDKTSSPSAPASGVDSVCGWIESYFVDPKGNPLAGAGEMYQARERLVRLLADPWREGTCEDFTDDLIGNLSAQTFSTVRQCVNYIESVCRRCRRDGCLPSDPMKAGKPLQIQRENGTHDAEAEARFAKARAILEAEEQENRR